MSYKTITTIMTDAKLCRPALVAAKAMAEQYDAHLDVICLGIDQSQQGFYYAGASAMVVQDNLCEVRELTNELELTVRQDLAAHPLPWSTVALTTQMVALSGIIAHRTRFADLVVMPRPYDGQTYPKSAENIVVAWNESPEALRATRQAMPFLKKADNVSIAVIDPPQHGPERSDPGGALSQMLDRHGVRAEVSVLAKTMPRISDILNRHIRDRDADFIVMGAYGHSRFRESILGGATRHMLEVAEVPAILAH